MVCKNGSHAPYVRAILSIVTIWSNNNLLLYLKLKLRDFKNFNFRFQSLAINMRPATLTTSPATHQALVINDKDEAVVWKEAPCPPLPPDQVLVRTDAIAINPSDTKMRGAFVTPWATLGCDYAGTVVAVGSEVQDVSVGDRICGVQNEMCKYTTAWGAFGEYNVTRGKMWMKVPDSWSTEAAASISVGIATASLALRALGLPLPNKPVERPASVLIYGGSSATATIALQLIRLWVPRILSRLLDSGTICNSL